MPNPSLIIAVGLMIAIITLADAFSKRLKNTRSAQEEFEKEFTGKYQKLEERFNAIETRLSNIETVLIDRDKEDKFTKLSV